MIRRPPRSPPFPSTTLSRSAAAGAPYAMRFPVITIRDMVRAQAMLLDFLGVDRLLAAIGGSMGGMQVVEWAATYPARLRAAVVDRKSTRLNSSHANISYAVF